MLISIISFLSSRLRLKVIPKLYKFNFKISWQILGCILVNIFYLLGMCSILCVRGFCKADVMLALAFLRKPFNLLFSAVPDALPAFILKTKVLQLQKFWKITKERNQWHFQEKILHCSLHYGSFQMQVLFHLISQYHETTELLPHTSQCI